MSLAIRILTLFPDMIRTVLETSISGRAAKQGLVAFDVVDIRGFSTDKHRTVDDYPYGGGAGMIMMAPPIVEAVEASRRNPEAPLLLMSPRGEKLREDLVLDLLAESRGIGEIILICGHYKGLDQRINDLLRPREISVGDYVLSGGELPALIVADAMIRRIPGVLGNSDSAESDSFTAALDGRLEGAWYTRPPNYRGLEVPDILLSGHHARIKEWRRKESVKITRDRRPDIMQDT